MSVHRAKTYYRRMDDSDIGIRKAIKLYADDAVLTSPREGTFRTRDEIREFYELNASFSLKGVIT